MIAEYLGLSVSDTLKTKMVIDTDKRGIYNPKWANEAQLDIVGRFLPYNRTWDRGYCIFFDRRTHDCLIYEVRPKSARVTECWNEDDCDCNPEVSWSKELLLKLCPELNFSEED